MFHDLANMQRSFFDERAREPDSPYGSLCDPRTAHHKEARDFIERLYSENHQFVGTDLPANARSQLGQSFWELYLADALRRRGLPLVPRLQRRSRAGPDFQVGRPNMWIEAIAPGPGMGPDRVPELPLDQQARRVPDDQVQLRYLGAIDEKKRKLDDYLKQGIVGRDEPYLIALNGADVSTSGDFDPPRIVRLLFGIGWPIAHLSKTTGRVERFSWQDRLAVRKANGTAIATTGFLADGLVGVSAVIFSLATPWSGIHDTGCDFIVAHNPGATNKVPVGLLPAYREYRLEGDNLVTG